MKLTSRFFVLILLSCFSFSWQAFALTASYVQEIKLNGTPVTQHQVKIKGKRQRIEAEHQGQKHVLIKNENGYFSYSPLEQAAMKLPDPDPSQSQFTDDIGQYLQFLNEKGATKTGSEAVLGHECDIYEFSDAALGTQNKVWVWKEHGFPLRIETNSPQGLINVELSSVEIDPELDDALFEVPEGTPVMDVSAGIPPQQMQATQ